MAKVYRKFQDKIKLTHADRTVEDTVLLHHLRMF